MQFRCVHGQAKLAGRGRDIGDFGKVGHKRTQSAKGFGHPCKCTNENPPPSLLCVSAHA